MKKSNLVLHCGARAISRDQLNEIQAPAPVGRWHPIPYGRLITEIERSLGNSKMRIVNEAYGVTEENKRMFGLLQVANCQETKDYAYVIGVRGSIDKSLAESVAVGSSVFVCDNMAFSGEIHFARKNTSNILVDLPQLVDTAIGQLSTRWNDQNTRIEAYKQKHLSRRDAMVLTMEAAEAEVFPWAKGWDIFQEFKSPRHDEFKGDTLWGFFNGVTEHLKPRTANSKASGLWTMPARTMRLHKICDDWAGLQINTNPIPATMEVPPIQELLNN